MRPGIDCLRFINRRIRSRWSNGLNADHEDNQKDRDDLQNSLHWAIIHTNNSMELKTGRYFSFTPSFSWVTNANGNLLNRFNGFVPSLEAVKTAN